MSARPQATALASIGLLLPRTATRRGGVYFLTRAANGALALAHVWAVGHALGSEQAGHFFMLWTSAWLLSVAVRFGSDGVVARALAEADAARRPPASLGGVLIVGLAVAALLFWPLTSLVGAPDSPAALAALAVLAVAWAGTGFFASVLKARARADLAGWVQNVVWSLPPTLVALLASPLAIDSLLGLAAATAAAALLALLAAAAITARSLGANLALLLVDPRRERVAVRRDEIGAAVLTTLAEVYVWLPVLIGAVVGVSGAAAAGLFAATRIAGVFSWGYQAVVATLVPSLAASVARCDPRRARRLIAQGALGGLIVTLPICLVGAVAAGPILAVFSSDYAPWRTTLMLLIAARLLDAAAGPQGELILVGRKTWVGATALASSCAIGTATALLTHSLLGEQAIGLGAFAAFAFANVSQMLYVRRWVGNWRPGVESSRSGSGVASATGDPTTGDPAMEARATGAAAHRALRRAPELAAALALGFLTASVARPPRDAGGVLLCAAMVLLLVGSSLLLAARCFGLRDALLSPLGVAALMVALVFALRPAALALAPSDAAYPLLWLGFDFAELGRTAALGTLAFFGFGVAFAGSWLALRERGGAAGGGGGGGEGARGALSRPANDAATGPPLSERRLVGALGGALAVGTALWAILFFRNGGFAALLDDPSRLHLNQFGGGHYVFGFALCLGATLVAVQAWRERPTPRRLLLVGTASAVALAASVALQTRGQLLATGVAALALVASRGTITRSRALPLALAGVLLLAGFAWMRSVRELAQTLPLREAVAQSLHGNPLLDATRDFVEFDHLVVLEQLVPSELRRLGGRSLAQAPLAFLPRRLYPEKPLPIDFELARATMGTSARAGTPFTLAGELYWNFGWPAACTLLVAVGALGGAGWGLLRRRHGRRPELVRAIAFGYSYLLLTRPLGAMLLTTGLAVAAAWIVVTAAERGVRPKTLWRMRSSPRA